jgi:hypothetical protein
MAELAQSEFARAAAICVNFAVDGIEDDIRKELAQAKDDSAEILRRLIGTLDKRRIGPELLKEGGRS